MSEVVEFLAVYIGKRLARKFAPLFDDLEQARGLISAVTSKGKEITPYRHGLYVADDDYRKDYFNSYRKAGWVTLQRELPNGRNAIALVPFETASILINQGNYSNYVK